MCSPSKGATLALRQIAFVVIGTGMFMSCAVAVFVTGSALALFGFIAVLALTLGQTLLIGATGSD